MSQFGPWIESRGEVPGVARTARRPSAPAERTRGPAPSEANSPRRAKPIPRAGRTRASALRPPSCGPVRHRAGSPDPGPPATGPSMPRANPAPRPERTRAPAPSEPGRTPLVRRGAAPCGTGARTPSPPDDGPAPVGPEPRRRANPGVRLWFTVGRLRAGRGRDVRPRAARDLIVKGHPISSYLAAPAFSESASGCGAAPPPRAARGGDLGPQTDPRPGSEETRIRPSSRPGGGATSRGRPGPAPPRPSATSSPARGPRRRRSR